MTKLITWRWAAVVTAMAALAGACGGSGDDSTSDVAAAPTTTTTAPTTSTAPTTTAPTTTSTTVMAAEVPTGPLVWSDVRVETATDTATGVGSFEVTLGVDALGCESGDTRGYIISGQPVVDLTCTSGGDGDLGMIGLGSLWFVRTSTGDFDGTFGHGPRNIEVVDGVVYQVFEGSITREGPEGSGIEPRITDRLADRLGPCSDGFGSTDGRSETATVADRLLLLDIESGEITDTGPSPAPCALWLGDPASSRAVASNLDGTAMWFGTIDGPLDTMVSFDEPTSILSRSIRGDLLVVANSSSVVLLDALTGEAVGDPIVGPAGSGRAFSAHAYSPDGSRVAVAVGNDGTLPGGVVAVVDAATGLPIIEVETPEQILSLAFESADGLLFGLAESGLIISIELDSSSIVAETRVTALHPFSDIGVRSDGMVIAVALGSAVLLDPSDGTVIQSAYLGDAWGGRVRADGTIVSVFGNRHHVFDTFTLG